MTTQTDYQCRKIQWTSRVVSLLAIWGCLLSALLTLVSLVLVITQVRQNSTHETSPLVIYFQHVGVDFLALTQFQQVMLLGSLTLMLLLVTSCFYFLYRLFKAFKKQGVFSPRAIQCARLLAWAFSLTFVYALVADFVMPVPTESEALKAYANNLHFQDAILLGVVWIGVWVLEYGHALLSENEMTI